MDFYHYNEGENLELYCHDGSKTLGNVQWLKDQTIICRHDGSVMNCTSAKFFMSSIRNYLFIQNASLSDIGAYICCDYNLTTIYRTANVWIRKHVQISCQNADKILLLIVFAVIILCFLVAMLIQIRHSQRLDALKMKIL